MRLRRLALLLVPAAAVVAVAAAPRPRPAPLPAACPREEGPGGKYKYMGVKKCKMCHIHQYRSWSKTKMAHALDILKPGERAEAKKRAGLDANADYTHDPKCLQCHTTGFGTPSGYKILNPASFPSERARKKAERKNKQLAGVTCEACHGAGSGYLPLFKEINKSKRKYKQEELYALGMKKIGPDVCKECHNEKSPTYDKSKPFDYEKRKKQGTHEHKPLKLRAD